MSLKGIISKLYFNREEESSVFENYLEHGVSKINEDDVDNLLDNEDDIHERLSSLNSLGKYSELGKIMLSMIKDIKNGEYPETPWFTVATIGLCLLYLVNPFDVIPDFIPGIGYIDDVAVFSICIAWIETDLHEYLDWKIEQGQGI